MSRSKNHRSRDFPMGRTSLRSVVQSNLMVTRMALVQRVGFSKRNLYLLEQPLSSLMRYHDRMREAPFDKLWYLTTYMGAFAAPSAKPTRLFSTEMELLIPLQKKLTRDQMNALENEHLVHIFVEDCKVKVTGKTQEGGLKSSQEYTPEYAKAVVDSYV